MELETAAWVVGWSSMGIAALIVGPRVFIQAVVAWTLLLVAMALYFVAVPVLFVLSPAFRRRAAR